MKYAIVTGASTGIGREVAIELSKENFIVFLVSRNTEELEKTANLISEVGGSSKIFQVDLSSVTEVNRFIKEIQALNVTIDLLANIAAIWHGKSEVYAGKDFETFDQKIIVDTFSVGLIAPTLLCHGLIPFMKAKSKIINLSGTFEDGGKGWLSYYVSKRGLEDLTIGLAEELTEKNIQVNCISPSDTATESYGKFFPEYIKDSIDPLVIAKQFVELSNPANMTTGKIIVMKKGQSPFEGFHY